MGPTRVLEERFQRRKYPRHRAICQRRTGRRVLLDGDVAPVGRGAASVRVVVTGDRGRVRVGVGKGVRHESH